MEFFARNQSDNGKRPKDLGSVLYLRPYQPVQIKKCWRTPQEPFQILTCSSVILLMVGVLTGFLLYVSIDQLQVKRRDYQLSLSERRSLQLDLARIQIINRESNRNLFMLVEEVQHVLKNSHGERREFLIQMIPQALVLQAENQIPASATISMGIYESNYGQSDLAKLHNNFFGIKALDRRWAGGIANMMTTDSGKRHLQKFRTYLNFEQGVQGYGKFLTKSQRYRKAFHHNDGPSFVRELLAAGYCPDHDYLARIRQIMARHDLQRLDLHRLVPALAGEPSSIAEFQSAN
ncbi:MAG: glucosaminidase domain-containing protein [Verrucomicrobiota bacterium]